jgi:hypothetical protein
VAFKQKPASVAEERRYKRPVMFVRPAPRAEMGVKRGFLNSEQTSSGIFVDSEYQPKRLQQDRPLRKGAEQAHRQYYCGEQVEK